jgi:PAS domain S-box-containing protein
MKPIAVIFFLNLIICHLSFSQDKKDSLWILTQSQVDTLKAKAFLSLAKSYVYTEFDSSEYYLKKALDISIPKNYTKGIAQGYETKVLSKRMRGNNTGLLDTAELAMGFYKKLNNNKGIADVLNQMASFHAESGSPEKAISLYLQSLKLREQIKDSIGIAASLNNLGLLQYIEKNYTQAVPFLKQSLEIHKKINNIPGIGSTQISLAMAYQNLKKSDSSQIFYQNAIAIFKKLNNKKNLSICYNNLSNAFLSIDILDSAEHYAILAKQIQIPNKDLLGLLVAEKILSRIYLKRNELDRALSHAKISYKLSHEVNQISHVESASLQLYNVYKKMGDYKQALYYHEEYAKANDSIYTLEKAKISQRLQSRYEIDKKELEIKNIQLDYQNKLALQQSRNRLLIFALNFISLTAILILWGQYRLRKINSKLIETQNQLRKNLEEVKLLSSIANKTDNPILICDSGGSITWANPSYFRLSEYSLSEIQGQNLVRFLTKNETDPSLIDQFSQSINKQEALNLEIFTYSRLGKPYWINASINPLFDETGQLLHYFAVMSDITEIKTKLKQTQQQKEQIEALLKSQTTSISYAKKIQEAVFPTVESLKKVFPESFLIFKPKEMVSGDFYWLKDFDDIIVLAVGDCTGHGVPAAFTSLLAINLLESAVVYEKLRDPNAILENMALRFLQTDSGGHKTEFGMEMAVVVIDKIKKNMLYSGLKLDMVVIEDQKIQIYQANRVSFSNKTRSLQKFHLAESKTIKLNPTTKIYLFSDGFKDQFGGEENERIGINKFVSLLLETSASGFEQQEKLLKDYLQQWIKNQNQIDDILVLGLGTNL